ncbi:MAG: (d)CMP kinase [Candidatus Binatia bacterium]
MESHCFVVAIDGPAGAGKSTTSRMVAYRLGFTYLDSGALYRAAALKAINSKVDLADGEALARLLETTEICFGDDGRSVFLDGREVTSEIRGPEVSQAASKVSACAQVRERLVDIQRSAVRPPGTVVEGRDMGTVIFPHAQLKVYLDAEADERAQRRAREIEARSGKADLAAVRSEMAERDRRDSSRAVAPLRPAEGALVLDSTNLAIDEVVECIVKEARRGLSEQFS